MKSMCAKLVVVCLCVMTVCSCSYFRRTGSKQPGYLADYKDLQLNYDLQGVSVYRSTKTSLSKYSSIIIEPVIITLGPGAAGKAISPDELKDVSDYFRSQLAIALKSSFVPSERPGSGVARVRTVILNVVPGNPLTGQLSTDTALITGATIEVEFTDSQSNEKLFAMKDIARGGSKTKAASTREILGQWARLVRDKIDTVLGK